jgi:hypothetical protein
MTHITLILILAMVLSNALTVWCAPYAAISQEQPLVYAAEGIGIDGVAVGHSTMETVAARYGKEFKLVEHGTNSYEMEYSDLGFSFWYRHEDPQKKIYSITLKPPCQCFTARGILVGKSTLQDVFNAYGESKLSAITVRDSWTVQYPGVEFYVEYDPKDSSSETPRSLMKRKVTAIDIVLMEAKALPTPGK